MKNEYVKDVSNLKRRIKRYRKEFIQDKSENKSRKYGFSNQLNIINQVYTEYKDYVKKYNKGEISKEQVELAKERLSDTIESYKNYFSKENKKNIIMYEDEVLKMRIGGVKNIKNFNDVETVYKKVSDIINDAIERKNNIEGTNDDKVTPQDIYDRVFGGAIDSPYYEDIIEELAEKRNDFRQSVIKELKNGGYLSSQDEISINNLLSI